MNVVVVKFGGTSVATEEGRNRSASHIVSMLNKGKSVVAVVSAMGRKGAPYATDTLISLLHKNSKKDTLDLLMSCGEVISACVFADNLVRHGIDAVAITGSQAGIVTNGIFGEADIFDVDIKRIKMELYEGKVVIVAGFQGISVRNEVTTLGRGGSDTSAMAIGGFLNADAVHIFTDVPGIAVIDPKVVKKAKFMEQVDMRHMYTLACWGAGVIHPRAIAEAQKYNYEVSVRSTFNDGQGTRLIKNAESEAGAVGIAIMRECNLFEPDTYDNLFMEQDGLKRAVRVSPGSNYTLITVVFNEFSKEDIMSSIGDVPFKAQCFFDKTGAHIFTESDYVERVAYELHDKLFESVALNK
jgi:aspartate kinase